MVSTAILIGNAHYTRQQDLVCCQEDIVAMRALLEATGRFDEIVSVLDADGDRMQAAIRDALELDQSHEEVFIYFSGHGAQIGSEFFYCGSDFDSVKPHRTGLSHTTLHDLLRPAKPDLLVKVTDACSSGTLLIKTDRHAIPISKDGFRNVIQLSSSLEDQSSFGGEPLSEFTRSFLEACLTKTDGPVFYGDIINALRDKFIENDDQTPFFVSQGTGRELLSDDATKLEGFRDLFRARWRGLGETDEPEDTEDPTSLPAPISTVDLLIRAEQEMGAPEAVKDTVDSLFDGILTRFKIGEFGDLFELKTTEHSTFSEPTSRDFIIRVLARESRPDNFVTAEIKRVKKRQSAWERLNEQLSGSFMALNPDWTEQYDLRLNCPMERAQLRLVLKPKFLALKQLVLVLTCAPSLERCYVFEIVTQHARTDWDGFDSEGAVLVERWYKLGWTESSTGIVEKVCLALEDAIRKHVVSTTERLTKE